MRFAAFIPLVGCILNFSLALFVLFSSARQSANRVYFFWGLSIAVWNLGQFFLFTVQDAALALFWARFLWFGVIFIPGLLYHISLVIAGVEKRAHIWWVHGVSMVLALSNFTPWFIPDVRLNGNSGWYAMPGPGLWLFNVVFSVTFYSIYVVVKKRRQLPPIYRSRLDALIAAQTSMVVLGTNDLLPILGFDHYPFTTVPVYPYGSIAAVLYGIIIAYSVLQHHLLDIHVRLSSIAAQIVRFTFLTLTALGLLLVATLVFPNDFTLPALLSSLVVFMVSTAIATLVFPRIFGGAGLERLERRILGDHFEYQDRIRAYIKTITWHTERSSLLNSLHELFAEAFRFESYWIVLRDDTQRSFTLVRAHPEQPHIAIPELKVPSPVFSFFESERPGYLALGPGSVPPSRHLELEARDQLARFPAEFAFPLMHESEIFGLVLVGGKPDDAPMTATDLHLLVELSQQLSLVVNQIRLKDEIVRAQELELLGRMSRGMAHDLNNLITPIWTLLQLAHGGLVQEALDEDLVEVAHRNIQAVRSYIKESLFFSEHARPDLQLGRLDVVVRNTVEVAQSNLRKQVQIVADVPDEVLMEMDEVLIQRLLTNLIGNAIDASFSDNEIRVVIERVARTNSTRDWVRLSVVDHGQGIPKENLERVLTPYFTTKDRGDEARGFGLGLSISRRIVALHGGKMTIDSEVGRGTTVHCDLPTRQPRTPATDMTETV